MEPEEPMSAPGAAPEATPEDFRLLAENTSDILYRGDADGHLLWVSPSVTDVLGWRPEEVIGMVVPELIVEDDIATWDLVSARLNNGERARCRVRFLLAGGGWRWLEVDAGPLLDDQGVVIGRIGSARDIQEQVAARIALSESERRFRLMMASAPSGIALVDLDRRFMEVNPSLCAMLGRDHAWLVRHRVPDVIDPRDDAEDMRARSVVLSGRSPSATVEKRLLRADGCLLWVMHAMAVVRDDRGVPSMYVSQFVDIDEAKKAREDLARLAGTDSLTQLANRRQLLSSLEQVLAHPPRRGTLVGVLFMDLDSLKIVNDTQGHAAGDRLLQEVAARIGGQLRVDDLVARFGGDEFVAVLPGLGTADDARKVAAKVQDGVAVSMDLYGIEVTPSISIGIAVARPTEDADALLRRADQALYAAKRRGGGQAVLEAVGPTGDRVT